MNEEASIIKMLLILKWNISVPEGYKQLVIKQPQSVTKIFLHHFLPYHILPQNSTRQWKTSYVLFIPQFVKKKEVTGAENWEWLIQIQVQIHITHKHGEVLSPPSIHFEGTKTDSGSFCLHIISGCPQVQIHLQTLFLWGWLHHTPHLKWSLSV